MNREPLGPAYSRKRGRGSRTGLPMSLAVAASMFMPSGVAAQDSADFPAFNIAVSCQGTPDVATCARMEQDAKSQLASFWPRMSVARRRACVRLASQVEGGSYVTALSCATGR